MFSLAWPRRVLLRLIILTGLVVLLGLAISTMPGKPAIETASAKAGCCGVDNPTVACVDCGDAIQSCRRACGSPFTNFCIAEFSCNPSDPSNYICVCKGPEGDNCQTNLCP